MGCHYYVDHALIRLLVGSEARRVGYDWNIWDTSGRFRDSGTLEFWGNFGVKIGL